MKIKLPKQYTTDEESLGLLCFDKTPISPTRMRFVVISIMSITFLIQTFSQSIWSAIYEPALLAFPDWTSRSLSLLPIWGNLMTALLVLPVCQMVDKYGLKEIMLYSCCFFTLGTAVRCMPIMYSCTLCLHLSAVCLSVGSVVTTPLIVTMSGQWFPKKERNMAIGLCSAVSMLGSAATYIIGPMVVSTVSDGPLSRFVIRIQIMHMMYTCLGLNAFVTFIVYMLFPRHITPLSGNESMCSAKSHKNACKLICSLKTLVMNFKLWCLVFVLTLSNSMTVPWSALIPSTFSKLRVSPEITTKCCFFMIIHTFGLRLSISSFADRAPRYTKAFIMIWGSEKPSKASKASKAFQYITLRMITGALWFFTNESFHKDLKIPTINELAKNQYKRFHVKLLSHPNPLISSMSSSLPGNVQCRLKRN
ncbi:disrupted in renal carcinoma protein 2-like [Melanaphis sacchari]|uniref:disrupted in renal carcinoma protein 2-like n=1 Tax=Melanaphis sacchari TaxID=742174 RepID=UPI000DC146C6|nr:disrupted in renal carcinoma protein 2-like [Melanaphis sacchari]